MIVKEVSKYEPAHFFFWLFIGQDLLTVCNMQSALAGGAVKIYAQNCLQAPAE